MAGAYIGRAFIAPPSDFVSSFARASFRIRCTYGGEKGPNIAQDVVVLGAGAVGHSRNEDIGRRCAQAGTFILSSMSAVPSVCFHPKHLRHDSASRLVTARCNGAL